MSIILQLKKPFNCYDSIIPSQSQNIDADVMIYPEIITLEEFGGDYLASAGSCLLDKTNKRPLVGLVSLRADYNFTKANSFNYLEILLLLVNSKNRVKILFLLEIYYIKKEEKL